MVGVMQLNVVVVAVVVSKVVVAVLVCAPCTAGHCYASGGWTHSGHSFPPGWGTNVTMLKKK